MSTHLLSCLIQKECNYTGHKYCPSLLKGTDMRVVMIFSSHSGEESKNEYFPERFNCSFKTHKQKQLSAMHLAFLLFELCFHSLVPGQTSHLLEQLWKYSFYKTSTVNDMFWYRGLFIIFTSLKLKKKIKDTMFSTKSNFSGSYCIIFGQGSTRVFCIIVGFFIYSAC